MSNHQHVTARDPKGREVMDKFMATYAAAKLTPDQAQRLNESAGFAVYLLDGIRRFSATASSKPELLKSVVGMLAGRLTKHFRFQTREGLYVHVDEPMQQLLSGSDTIQPQKTAPMHGFDLLQPAVDTDIVSGLPPVYEVGLVQVAAAIEAQWGGKSGPLLTSGLDNIFYVNGLVLRVFFTADGEWVVYAYQRDEVKMVMGDRVFSGN